MEKFSKGLPVLVLMNGKFEKGQIVDVLNYGGIIRYEVFLEKNIGGGHYQEVEENQIKVLRKGGGK